MATAVNEVTHYTSYKARPFTREQRDKTTILFGGLTWTGAQAKIARGTPQGKQREQVEQGSNASYWPRRMDPTPPRNEAGRPRGRRPRCLERPLA